MSTIFAYSVPYPKVPEATSTGFFSINGCLAFTPSSSSKSIVGSPSAGDDSVRTATTSGRHAIPLDLVHVKHRAFGAYPEGTFIGLDNAAHADSHAASHPLLHGYLTPEARRHLLHPGRQGSHHPRR